MNTILEDISVTNTSSVLVTFYRHHGLLVINNNIITICDSEETENTCNVKGV